MSLILRVDVDSPYGKKNPFIHICSRLASDFDLPAYPMLPYLTYLNEFIEYLNSKSLQGYFFFRKCTLPRGITLDLLHDGKHVIGHHIENSRSFKTFTDELNLIENNIKTKVEAFSKHGSGKFKYGLYHDPLYEPDKYLEWGSKVGMKMFFGNLEDPMYKSTITNKNIVFFPAAYWLEPHWRDTKSFNTDWLIQESKIRDLVLLIHVENIFNNSILFRELELIISNTELKIL
jgi:hypothetical protein